MRSPADEEVTPLVKAVTVGQIAAFERCAADLIDRPDEPTIHTDPGRAAEAGLTGPPIASGMLSVAFLTEHLAARFGPAWARHGHLAVAFVASIRAGDTITVDSRVTEVQPAAYGRLVSLEVWCANQDGTRATVGTADVRLPPDDPGPDRPVRQSPRQQRDGGSS